MKTPRPLCVIQLCWELQELPSALPVTASAQVHLLLAAGKS